MESIKDRLLSLRKEKNINQDVIADMLHVSRSTVSNYENGLPVPIDTLITLAKYYDVSIEYLLCLTPERRPAAGALSEMFDQYAKVSQNADFTATDVAKVLESLTKYYRQGAPAGNLPPAAFRSFLSGFTSAVDAATMRDYATTLDAVNATVIAALDLSKMLEALYNEQKEEATLLTTHSAKRKRTPKHVEGRAAAGRPITAAPEHDRTVLVSDKFEDDRYFIVQAVGDSMIDAGINDGDYCVFDRDAYRDEGDIMLVQIDGCTDQPDDSIKRVYIHEGEDPDGNDTQVELRSDNPKYDPMFFPARDVRLSGVLVGITSKDDL